MSKSFSYGEKINRNKTIALIIFIFLVMVLFYNLINKFVFKTYRIQTNNMNPTLEAGEIVGVTPMFKVDSLQRGDLVFKKSIYKSDLNFFQKFINETFEIFTANFVQPFNEDRTSVTRGTAFRIVGLPGDTIYIDNFVAYIKNSDNKNFLTEFELSDISYNITTTPVPNNWENIMPFSGNTESFVLGNNEFFLMSDNRVSTLDSRLSGKCSGENIHEKIILVTWPISKWKKF